MKSFSLIWSISLLTLTLLLSPTLKAQYSPDKASVKGNFQVDAQYYRTDSSIGASAVDEKILLNSWMNVNYTLGKFDAGLRFETYLNPVNGYDPRYKGTGIPYWYANYHSDELSVTVGHIYDQFGSGMIFRTYEEHNLGIDNSLNGLRLKFTPLKGIDLKGVYGVERYFWSKGPGIVRGADADIQLNTLFKKLNDSKMQMQIGGSFVSKFEEYEKINDASGNELKLPLNVGAAAGRINATYGNFSIGSEYVRKINDPQKFNNFIYRKGEALLLNASYNRQGLGFFIQAKRLDNIAFKSKRTETGSVLNINYLPAISKEYTYSLTSLYPYATQPNGEMGVAANLNYHIAKNTFAGGKYGMDVAFNCSAVNAIERFRVNDSITIGTAGTLGYSSKFFAVGKQKYFRDFNIEVSRKISKTFKGVFNYLYQEYNIAVIEGHPDEPMVHAHIMVADIICKISPERALRLESQALFTKQDYGNALAAMVEYTLHSKWFFSLSQEWYYSPPAGESRRSYPRAAVAYNKSATQVQLSAGKQREGIICVGGVCRNVPAANGVTLSIITSF